MRTEKRELREVVVSATETCDLCGATIREREYHEDAVSICHRAYRRPAVELKHVCGPSYPEDGDVPTFEPDVCGRCFLEKVRPALEAIGLRVVYRNAHGDPVEPEPWDKDYVPIFPPS